MTTEYTGEEFRHIFNAAMSAWWAGNCEGADPQDSWECKTPGEMWNKYTDRKPPQYVSGKLYRFKPAPKRTVTIGYGNADSGAGINHGSSWKTLVAPESVAPEIGATYYLMSAEDCSEQFWEDIKCELGWLQQGRIFLTREDAQAMADWTAKCRGGGA